MPYFPSPQSGICNKFKHMTNCFHRKERKCKSETATLIISVGTEHAIIWFLCWEEKFWITISHSKEVQQKLWVSRRYCNSRNDTVLLLLLRNRNILLFWSSWPELAVELNYNSIRCQLIYPVVFERRWNTVVHANHNRK